MPGVFKKDKAGNYREIRSIKAAKEAGIDDVGEFFLDTYFDEMEDLCKSTNEKLIEKSQGKNQNELYPVGFTPYNDIWRYEPVESKYLLEKMIGFTPTPLQMEAIDIICGKDPFKFTDSRFEEADLMWGKRSGKDTIISLSLVIQAYKICCMMNPQQFLGMGIGSSIDIVNVASSGQQAKNVFFKYLKTYVKMLKDPDVPGNWFALRNFWWDVGKEKFVYMDLRESDGNIKQNSIEFGKGSREITCHSLTSDRFTGEGLNIILAIMDEIGAMRKDRVFGTSDKNVGQYDSLSATARSTSTKNLGKLVAMSYKYGRNCPMSMLVKRNKNDPKKFVRKYSVYDVRADVSNGLLREQFDSEYRKDPEKAAMMYECIDPKVDTDNLYSNQYILKNAIDGQKKYTINPFVNNLITVDDISKGASQLLQDWFIGNKDSFYSIHMDLAKGQIWKGGDAAAIAMGHIEEMRISYDRLWVDYYKREYGIDLSEQEGQLRYGIVMDLVVQIISKTENKEIRISDVRRFVTDLYQKRGFQIFKATIDGWQSLETIQELNNKGIEAELLSIDKNPSTHQTQKDYAQLGLFKIYEHPIWERESRELIEDNGKIDHPELSVDRYDLEGVEHGSKDVVDCTAGVSFNLASEVGEGGSILF